MQFRLISENVPTGDQPGAIEQLVEGLNDGVKDQVLLGITGSGKTFTIANVIQRVQRPTLVLAITRRWRRSFIRSLRRSFPRTRSSILFRITTITSLKRMFPRPIFT